MKHYRLLIAAVVVAVATTAAILFVPPPAAVTRAVVLRSSSWLLTDYMRETGGPLVTTRRVWRKFVATYADHALAVEFYRHHKPTADDDVQRMSQLLMPLARNMVNQLGVRHPVSTWPVFASGLGACDQVNGAGAHLLAVAGFPKAEVYGVVLPHDAAQHSIGRVWSTQRSEWLYFDVWPDNVVIFRAASDGRAEYLVRAAPMAERFDPPGFSALLEKVYDNTALGFAHNEFSATFGGYLWLKATRAIKEQTLESVSVAGPPALDASAPQPVVAQSWSKAPAFDRAYLEARLQQIRGDEAGAASRYRAIAAQAHASDARTDALLRVVDVWLRELRSHPISTASR